MALVALSSWGQSSSRTVDCLLRMYDDAALGGASVPRGRVYPPLQRTLAHMESIRGALDMAGNCLDSIPLTLVISGAYFYASPTVAVTVTRACLTATQRDPRGQIQILNAHWLW
ncbi:uncharacterized protein C8Q71DRAFT_204998 [Rhodofomes roseus]|uniref:Uncharacterized protein n=1 Tax=Rhodofomes roseus TaxID=34475 RepID=A0ABQ8KVW3_9APHY|nr:uncharacterized protein C8Q71DRAFT_204998 [Rhodofomes roseus]KAH9842483.1 hypothetical protein C8Q71DRAFT_204998 [Rhodofomes roseus]